MWTALGVEYGMKLVSCSSSSSFRMVSVKLNLIFVIFQLRRQAKAFKLSSMHKTISCRNYSLSAFRCWIRHGRRWEPLRRTLRRFLSPCYELLMSLSLILIFSFLWACCSYLPRWCMCWRSRFLALLPSHQLHWTFSGQRFHPWITVRFFADVRRRGWSKMKHFPHLWCEKCTTKPT